MWKLVALLASLLLVTEVAGDCRALTDCDSFLDYWYMDYLDQNIDKSMVISYFLGNDVHEIRKIVPHYTSCVDRSLRYCEDEETRDTYEAKSNLLQYLCSPLGSELASHLVNTPDCGHGELFDASILPQLTTCYEVFTDGISNDCSQVKKLRQCLVNSAPKSECHDAMVTYIGEVWSHATGKKYERLGCPSQ
ncbi:hypothetical protein PoB_003609000 [Plakobranchus ocellatus]|uniref:Uncharacterized protein n=1 Tax=Plakobranchus ocellatus TaxID=259542 RepID=A0AAV4ART4_9GAST|nr:hypothetical protein PoB_003609000 [Plakobranchus ocellatus]